MEKSWIPMFSRKVHLEMWTNMTAERSCCLCIQLPQPIIVNKSTRNCISQGMPVALLLFSVGQSSIWLIGSSALGLQCCGCLESTSLHSHLGFYWCPVTEFSLGLWDWVVAPVDTCPEAAMAGLWEWSLDGPILLRAFTSQYDPRIIFLWLFTLCWRETHYIWEIPSHLPQKETKPVQVVMSLSWLEVLPKLRDYEDVARG